MGWNFRVVNNLEMFIFNQPKFELEMKTLKNRNVVIVGLLFVIVAVLNGFHLYSDIKTFEQFYNVDLSMAKTIKGFFISGSLIVPFILASSIVGLCLPNQAGWVFANSFFFYILSKALIRIPLYQSEWYSYIIVTLLLLPVLLTSNVYVRTLYKIKETQKLTLLLTTILLGLFYAFSHEYYNLNYSISTFEIIDKLGI